MNKFFPIQKNNQFYHPLHLSDHEPESFLFGTFPSFAKAWLMGWFRKKHDVAAWVHPYHPIEHDGIVWIGHATFLIKTNGVTILTDPIFGHLFPFFRRQLPVGIALDQLPQIDYVIISHNHRDHMDAPSLKQLKKKNPYLKFLVPLGDKHWFDRWGLSDVYEFNWWDEHLSTQVRFVFLPAVHWSARGLFDKNKSLWGSWMIEGSQRIYFAGDTAYGVHFDQIKQHFEPIDTALMPIGPCEPHHWMRKTHVNAEQAVQACIDLHAKNFIPMHWGTFGFGADSFDLPIKRLHTAWNETTARAQLHVLKVGQWFRYEIELPISIPKTKPKVSIKSL